MTCIRGYRIHVLGRGVFCSCTRSEALMMECSFNLEVFFNQSRFYLQSRKDWKSRPFLPGDWRLYKFEIWKSDYRWLQIWRNSSFCFFYVKLWLKEGNYWSLIFIQIHLFDVRKYRFLLITTYVQHSKTVISIYLESIMTRLSCLRFSQFSFPWEKSSIFFSLLGYEAKSDFDHKTSKIKSHSTRRFKMIPERLESDSWSTSSIYFSI